MTFIEGEYESIFKETNISNNKTIIGDIYRAPNNNLQKSLEHYDKILSQLKDTETFIIATDRNIDLLKVESHKHTVELLSNMFASSLIPTINKPTHITHSTATLIDNIQVKFNHIHTKANSTILTFLIIHLFFVSLPTIRFPIGKLGSHSHLEKKEI